MDMESNVEALDRAAEAIVERLSATRGLVALTDRLTTFRVLDLARVFVFADTLDYVAGTLRDRTPDPDTPELLHLVETARAALDEAIGGMMDKQRLIASVLAVSPTSRVEVTCREILRATIRAVSLPPRTP